MHQFVIGQPDLNYREPLVVEEMKVFSWSFVHNQSCFKFFFLLKNVLRFWLDRGVAGFRVDAVPYLFEVLPDKNGIYPDEPRADILHTTDQDYNYTQHIYTMDQEETYDMIYQWRAVLDEYEKKDGIPRVMLTEGYTDIKNVMKYYGNATHNGSHLPFNFEFLGNVNKGSDARDMKYYIDKWITYMPVGRTANWVVSLMMQNSICH